MKKKVFSTNGSQTIRYPHDICERMSLDPSLTLYTIINSKYIKDPNLRANLENS